MKRLITFGCSFTDYSWPTWADIIALDREVEYENWAIGGGGNQQIARRALYRWSRGFDSTDWVMVQWTSITREDRFLSNRWRAEGSVFNSPTYKNDFVRKYWDWDNDVIATAHSRITTELLLKPWLKYQMAMTWYDDGSLLNYSDNTKLTEYWHKHLPQVDEVPANAHSFNGKSNDGHPDPLWWMTWVETKIYPQFGWQIKPTTRERVMAVQDYAETLVKQGLEHSRIQHLTNIFCNKQGWRFAKVKPGSDTLTPGLGSDILM